VPSFLSRICRFSQVALLVTVVVTLLAGCAGGGQSASGSNQVAPTTQPGAVNDAAAASQPTQEPVAARINGQAITVIAFQRERDRRALGLEIQPATAAAFDASVLQTMIDQVLIEQAATREGIVVTDAEIDAELSIQADLASANGQTLEGIVSAQMYTMDEYRAVIRGMLIAQKLSQVVANVSPYAVQVHSRHILVTDEATARALLAQIQQGADFAQLALQYSLDGSTAPTGGDLDWVSRGDLLQPEVEDAIFALEPGQISPEPVKSSLGYHIVQVLEKVEDRPLSQAALAEKQQQAFMAWLDSQRQAAVIERYVGSQ